MPPEIPEVISDLKHLHGAAVDCWLPSWLSNKREVIEEHGDEYHQDMQLFSTGNDLAGYYVLYGKVTHRVLYFMRYKVVDETFPGRTATQILVWKRAGNAYPGISRKVVFQYFLSKHKTIISDAEQRGEGKTLWGDLVSIAAARRDFEIGIVNLLTHEFENYDSSKDGSADEWFLKSLF